MYVYIYIYIYTCIYIYILYCCVYIYIYWYVWCEQQENNHVHWILVMSRNPKTAVCANLVFPFHACSGVATALGGLLIQRPICSSYLIETRKTEEASCLLRPARHQVLALKRLLYVVFFKASRCRVSRNPFFCTEHHSEHAATDCRIEWPRSRQASQHHWRPQWGFQDLASHIYHHISYNWLPALVPIGSVETCAGLTFV